MHVLHVFLEMDVMMEDLSAILAFDPAQKTDEVDVRIPNEKES